MPTMVNGASTGVIESVEYIVFYIETSLLTCKVLHSPAINCSNLT